MKLKPGDERLPLTFWSKVTVGDGGCWLWTGGTIRGYGQYFYGNRTRRAHRVSYEALVGPITSETLDHLCRVRCCVNPGHLEQVSNRENVLRGNSIPGINSRKTACPRGHKYEGENLLLYRGFRYCRACRAASSSARCEMLRALGEEP